MSSSSSSSSREEKPKSVIDLYLADADKEAHDAAEAAWERRNTKVKAFQEMLDRHKELTPIYTPSEVVVPELHREVNLGGHWYLEEQGNDVFFIASSEWVHEDEHTYVYVYNREGEYVRSFTTPYDIDFRENALYFGIPISYNPSLPYRHDKEQINIQHITRPKEESVTLAAPSDDEIEDVFDEEVDVSDSDDSDEGEVKIAAEKSQIDYLLCEAYETDGIIKVGVLEKGVRIKHFGTVPHTVTQEENDYYESYVIRNMQTHESSFFVFEKSEEMHIATAPFLLRGEIYFILYGKEDEEDERKSYLMHARSHKIVYSWPYEIYDVIASCTGFAVCIRHSREGTRLHIMI